MAELEGRQPLTREQVEALVEWTKSDPDLFQGDRPYKTAAIAAVVTGTALRYFRQGLEVAAGLRPLQIDSPGFLNREIDLTKVVRTAKFTPEQLLQEAIGFDRQFQQELIEDVLGRIISEDP